VSVVTGATGNSVRGARDAIAAQLNVLASKEAQATGPGCFEVQQGNIINDSDIFNPGGKLLLRDWSKMVCIEVGPQ
jgi:hypothetical protein